jgi:hypothetical protein
VQQERHAKNHSGRNRRDVGLKYNRDGGAILAEADSAGSGRVSTPMGRRKNKIASTDPSGVHMSTKWLPQVSRRPTLLNGRPTCPPACVQHCRRLGSKSLQLFTRPPLLDSQFQVIFGPERMTARFAYRNLPGRDWCSRCHVTLAFPTMPCVHQQTRIFRWRRCLKLFLLHGARNNAAACARRAPRYSRVCEPRAWHL